MAKSWFFYTISSTTYPAQINPQNYYITCCDPPRPDGFYPEDSCFLADRTCIIYSFRSSQTNLPSYTPGGWPAISLNLQSYIALNITSGSVVNRPIGFSKKYLYVRGG